MAKKAAVKSIDLQPLGEHILVEREDSNTVTAGGIIAVMFDKDACFIAGEHPTTKALPNPDGDFTNFFHKWKASYYNDTAENAVVYVLADPVITED